MELLGKWLNSQRLFSIAIDSLFYEFFYELFYEYVTTDWIDRKRPQSSFFSGANSISFVYIKLFRGFNEVASTFQAPKWPENDSRVQRWTWKRRSSTSDGDNPPIYFPGFILSFWARKNTASKKKKEKKRKENIEIIVNWVAVLKM